MSGTPQSQSGQVRELGEAARQLFGGYQHFSFSDFVNQASLGGVSAGATGVMTPSSGGGPDAGEIAMHARNAQQAASQNAR